MERFYFRKVNKVMIWEEEIFYIDAETQELANKIISNKFDKNMLNNHKCKFDLDTKEFIKPSNNNGEPTELLYNSDGGIIKVNNGDDPDKYAIIAYAKK